MHILLVRFSSLGDVVLQTGFISWLKFVNPNIKISFITSKSFESLLSEHKDVDHIYGYEKTKGLKDILRLKKYINQINEVNRIDFIIDLHQTTRASYLKLITPSIPFLSIDKRKVERHFLVNCGLKLLNKTRSIHSRNIHDFYGLFNTSKSLQGFSADNKFKFNNSNLNFSTPLNLSIEPKHKTIIVAPVASFKNKRWSIDRYKELILKLLSDQDLKDYSFLNLAGPTDSFCDVLDDIQNMRFKNLQGKTSLKETIGHIQSSSYLIGNDSGLGHIAESFGVGVLSIFGPTHETLGFKPHLDNSVVVSKKMWCRPCSPTGKGRCFRLKQHCMNTITVDDVYRSFKEAFNYAL